MIIMQPPVAEMTGAVGGRPAPGRGRENRAGIFLCLTDAVCLALLGAVLIFRKK